MCFDFFCCYESYVVPVKKLEIEKVDPDSYGKYYCTITLNNLSEKKVILDSLKIMTLWDAMALQVKKQVIFPSFFRNYNNARSCYSAQKIYDKIINNKYEQPKNFVDQLPSFFDSLMK